MRIAKLSGFVVLVLLACLVVSAQTSPSKSLSKVTVTLVRWPYT